jgi:hypothetical protein
MSRRSTQELVEQVVEAVNCITMYNAYGTDMPSHVKMSIILNVRAEQVKRWILGLSYPTDENIDKLTEFLEKQKWKS